MKRFFFNKVLWLLAIWYFVHTDLLYGQSVRLVPGTTEKIEQLVGDWDNERKEPTANQTFSRYSLPNTDLGIPFYHQGKTYLLFGDVFLVNEDPMAYTTDTEPEDGIDLVFLTGPDDRYHSIQIPGVSLEGFEVPVEGISWNDIMYIYCTTDEMNKSIVARSDDQGYTFVKLYDVSVSRFVNLSIIKSEGDQHFPGDEGKQIQLMFGSGPYRESNVYLAYQCADEIGQPALHYYTGVEGNGNPVWSDEEDAAISLFDQACVGELSVSYNSFIGKYILLYNCGEPRGINCRVADQAWGPWSEPFIIFDPGSEGYCRFIHQNWEMGVCDSVHDPGRENEWGGEYGPYQFDRLATGSGRQTTLYYTMSTWNPYTVVLMKSTLELESTGDETMKQLFGQEPRIYPNPSFERIRIELPDGRPMDGHVRLYSLSGSLIWERLVKTDPGQEGAELDIGQLPQGMYIMDYQCSDAQFLHPSVKVIKM